MPQRNSAAVRRRAVGRLGVLPRAGTSRRVATVADGEMPAQRRQSRLVEDLGDQPELLVNNDRRAVRDGHPGSLLAAVLQGIEPEVRQLGDILAGRPDAEDTASILRGLLPSIVIRAQGRGVVQVGS